MQKKYIVRLTDDERDILRSVVKKLKGSSQKVRRAQMLLKADAEGPNWIDKQIAEAFSCRTKTVENVRQKFVTEGFDASLNRKKRDTAPRTKLLDGEQEARSILQRLAFCYTPKHGSWLNIAENELSSLTRQCLSRRRIPSLKILRGETAAWASSCNSKQRGVDWQFTIGGARRKLK